MHTVGIIFAGGRWYGICTCGWTSGSFLHSTDAIGAASIHKDAQMN